MFDWFSRFWNYMELQYFNHRGLFLTLIGSNWIQEFKFLWHFSEYERILEDFSKLLLMAGGSEGLVIMLGLCNTQSYEQPRKPMQDDVKSSGKNIPEIAGCHYQILSLNIFSIVHAAAQWLKTLYTTFKPWMWYENYLLFSASCYHKFSVVKATL